MKLNINIAAIAACMLSSSNAFQSSILSLQRPSTEFKLKLRKLNRITSPNDKNVCNRNCKRVFPSESSTSLALMSPNALSALTAPLGSVSVLAFVILIHEAGHFLAARRLGITVKEFSVGVGPKITGFRRVPSRNGDAEVGDADTDEYGIDFNLRAIPLGGYVRFPENYNTTLEILREEEASALKKEAKRLIKEEENEKKARLNNAMDVGEEKERKWWKNPLSFNNFMKKSKPVEVKTKSGVILKEDGTIFIPPTEYYEEPNLLQNRPWHERAIVLSAGVVFNIILAFSLYMGQLTIGNGIPKPQFAEGTVISAMPKVDGPSAGLLSKGDVIIALNGEPITSVTSPSSYQSQEGISRFIANIRETKPGESLHLSVVKYNAKSLTEIDIKPRPMNPSDPSSPISIGTMLAPNYIGQSLVKATSVSDAFLKASDATTELLSETSSTLIKFFGSLLAGKGAPAGQSMSGPIGVIKTGSDVVSTNDFNAVIAFAAAISINLAVVNSLPLPALDGGQLVFVLAEAVTGKKIDQKAQEALNAVALLFLLVFSFSTVVTDLSVLGGK